MLIHNLRRSTYANSDELLKDFMQKMNFCMKKQTCYYDSGEIDRKDAWNYT